MTDISQHCKPGPSLQCYQHTQKRSYEKHQDPRSEKMFAAQESSRREANTCSHSLTQLGELKLRPGQSRPDLFPTPNISSTTTQCAFLSHQTRNRQGLEGSGNKPNPTHLILEEVFDTKCERKQWVKILKLDFKSIMTSIVHSL